MDPQNSMWLGVDPLTEKYPNLTGYCYTNNNPVKYIDPTGTDWYRNDETAAIFWQEGNANSITYDGQEYRNIGETYSIYQSGMRYDYQQDKIIKVSDASGRFNVEGGQYIPKSFITDDGTKVSVTFKYKSPTGGYGDYALSKDAVSLLIKGINDANISGAGITSIDVSTTTTGKHSPSSNHYASNGGRAIDIDMVNGISVKNPKSHEKVDAFQRAIRKNPILRENFGPNIQEKEGKTKRISGHNNHIHIATQKR
jgi:RHS repeat-associated core domain protein